jgi:hypothetical protein
VFLITFKFLNKIAVFGSRQNNIYISWIWSMVWRGNTNLCKPSDSGRCLVWSRYQFQIFSNGPLSASARHQTQRRVGFDWWNCCSYISFGKGSAPGFSSTPWCQPQLLEFGRYIPLVSRLKLRRKSWFLMSSLVTNLVGELNLSFLRRTYNGSRPRSLLRRMYQ